MASLLNCWGRGPARGSLPLPRGRGALFFLDSSKIEVSFLIVFDDYVENPWVAYQEVMELSSRKKLFSLTTNNWGDLSSCFTAGAGGVLSLVDG